MSVEMENKVETAQGKTESPLIIGIGASAGGLEALSDKANGYHHRVNN